MSTLVLDGNICQTEEVHISTIQRGDTVVIDGMLKTVGRSNIKLGFMGKTLFGDSFRLGLDPVTKVTRIGSNIC